MILRLSKERLRVCHISSTVPRCSSEPLAFKTLDCLPKAGLANPVVTIFENTNVVIQPNQLSNCIGLTKCACTWETCFCTLKQSKDASGFSLCIYIWYYQGQIVSDEDLILVLDWNPTCVDAYAIRASSNTIVHKVPLQNSQYLDQHRLDLWKCCTGYRVGSKL